MYEKYPYVIAGLLSYLDIFCIQIHHQLPQIS